MEGASMEKLSKEEQSADNPNVRKDEADNRKIGRDPSRSLIMGDELNGKKADQEIHQTRKKTRRFLIGTHHHE